MKFIDFLIEAPSDMARSIAQDKHSYQYRKFSKEPFFKHPSRVADIVSRFTKDDEIISAAYLHDTLEDTKTSTKELDAIFGKNILKYVQELTSVKVEIVKIGKAPYLLKKMLKMSDGALLIKLADRLDNVSDFKFANKKFIDKYTKETFFILENLNRSLKSEHKMIIKEIVTQLQIWENK